MIVAMMMMMITMLILMMVKTIEEAVRDSWTTIAAQGSCLTDWRRMSAALTGTRRLCEDTEEASRQPTVVVGFAGRLGDGVHAVGPLAVGDELRDALRAFGDALVGCLPRCCCCPVCARDPSRAIGDAREPEGAKKAGGPVELRLRPATSSEAVNAPTR